MTMAFHGVSKVFLCNRTGAKATALANDINDKVRDCAESVPDTLYEIRETLEACDILVNATSVGMHPNDDAIPLDTELLHDGLAVADLVYMPLETRLLAAARQLGCPTVNGLGIRQALGIYLYGLLDISAPVVASSQIIGWVMIYIFGVLIFIWPRPS